jgi:phospholipid/cholesterol/gamma-HCH transport system ATP-binding protein
VLIEGTIGDMLKSEDPWVRSYFRGKRARRIETIEQETAGVGG